MTVVLRYEIGCHLRPRQDGSLKYEFSPINPYPGLSCVGEAAAVEPALVGSIGKKRRCRTYLAADAGVDFAP